MMRSRRPTRADRCISIYGASCERSSSVNPRNSPLPTTAADPVAVPSTPSLPDVAAAAAAAAVKSPLTAGDDDSGVCAPDEASAAMAARAILIWARSRLCRSCINAQPNDTYSRPLQKKHKTTAERLESLKHEETQWRIQIDEGAQSATFEPGNICRNGHAKLSFITAKRR